MNNRLFRRFIAITLVVLLACSPVNAPALAQGLPSAAEMVQSPLFHSPILQGVVLDPLVPLRFNFYIDSVRESTGDDALRFIKYFLAALTIPEKDWWVNLSPYEKDRMIDEQFGLTDMGRDLLSQDYVLKHMTASLLDPSGDTGKDFWDQVYRRMKEFTGSSAVAIPMEALNKVWVMPDIAEVYQEGGRAFILKSRLKVLLEEDYRLQRKSDGGEPADTAKEAMRQVIIPVLEKEVNEGKSFAGLRQIYHALILATWYKRTMREGILGKVYVDQKKTPGIEQPSPGENLKIYDKYLQSFQNGIFNYVREEVDAATGEMVARKYFSGGFSTGGELDRRLVVRGRGSVPSGTLTAMQERSLTKVCVDLAQKNDKNTDAFIVGLDNLSTVLASLKRLSLKIKADAYPAGSKEFIYWRKVQNKLVTTAFKMFLFREGRNLIKDPGRKIQDFIMEAMLNQIVSGEGYYSVQELIRDGEYTLEVFYQLLALAKIAYPIGNNASHEVLELLGLRPELTTEAAKVIDSLIHVDEYDLLYQDVFGLFDYMDATETVFLDPGVNQFVRVEELRNQDPFWNVSFHKNHEKQEYLAKINGMAKGFLPLANDRARQLLGKKVQFFSRVKTVPSMTGKFYKETDQILIQFKDVIGTRGVVKGGLSELEKYVLRIRDAAVDFRSWEQKMRKEEMALIRKARKKKNAVDTDSVKLFELRERLENSRDLEAPILVRMDNRFVSHRGLGRGYYRAVHFLLMLGVGYWTMEIQMKTLLGNIAQDLEHMTVYKKKDNILLLGQDDVGKYNWLVNIVEALNYLYQKKQVGPDRVQAFLRARLGSGSLMRGESPVDDAQVVGGIDASNIDGTLTLSGDINTPQKSPRALPYDISGFSPVIRFVEHVRGFPVSSAL